MKKFIVLFLMAVFSTAIFATEPVKYGVVAGLSESGLTGNSQKRLGFTGGFSSEIPIIQNRIYLSPSLLYANRQYYLYLDNGLTRKENGTFQYIDLPILIKLKSDPIIGQNVKAFLSVGPTISYLISLHNKYGYVDYAFQSNNFYALKHFSYSAGLNIGLEYKNKFQMSIGYNFGIGRMTSSPRFENSRQDYISLTFAYYL